MSTLDLTLHAILTVVFKDLVIWSGKNLLFCYWSSIASSSTAVLVLQDQAPPPLIPSSSTISIQQSTGGGILLLLRLQSKKKRVLIQDKKNFSSQTIVACRRSVSFTDIVLLCDLDSCWRSLEHTLVHAYPRRTDKILLGSGGQKCA